MPYPVSAYRLLVSAPGDVDSEDLAAVNAAISRWNVLTGPQVDAVIVPRHWRTAAAAEHGVRPQASLNEQLVEGADIVVVLFWHRLGTPTGEAASGTVEELERAAGAGAYVAVLTCERPIPTSVDLAQLQALRDFREHHRLGSLMLGYDTPASLENQIESILMRAVSKLGAATLPDPIANSGADVWPSIRERDKTRTDSAGRTSVDTTYRLVLTNHGSAPARDVRFRITSEGSDLSAPRVHHSGGDDELVLETLAPGGEAPYTLGVHMGVAPQFRCVVTWLDDDEERENAATLRMF